MQISNDFISSNSLYRVIEGTGLECYYCYGHAGTEHDDCDSDIFGKKIECQMQNPELPYFGDVCAVGHTGI